MVPRTRRRRWGSCRSARESVLPLELEEAIEQKCPVMMEYLDGSDNRTQRVVEPLHIRRRRGQLLMIAYCHLRSRPKNVQAGADRADDQT